MKDKEKEEMVASRVERQSLLTINDLMKVLKISRTQAYRLLYTGEIPYIKIGEVKGFRIPLREVAKFLQKQGYTGTLEEIEEDILRNLG